MSQSDTIELDYLLTHRNTDGKVYACDVDRFLGVGRLEFKKKFELQDKFNEMADRCQK